MTALLIERSVVLEQAATGLAARKLGLGEGVVVLRYIMLGEVRCGRHAHPTSSTNSVAPVGTRRLERKGAAPNGSGVPRKFRPIGARLEAEIFLHSCQLN